MKIIKTILILAVFSAAVFLLINTNPTEEQFINWIIDRANQHSESPLSTFLNQTISRPVLSLASTRRDYTLFSIYLIEGLEGQSRYLGILNQFIPLDGLLQMFNSAEK